MTEAEWLGANEPEPMLTYLRYKGNDRKLRLFASGCVRRFCLHRLSDGPGRNTVEIAEKAADGELSTSDLRRAYLLAAREVKDVPDYDATHADPACSVSRADSWEAGYFAMHNAGVRTLNWPESKRDVAVMLQDIFGNPFRPVAFAPEWRTADTMALAESMYQDRAFDRMPILADALEDAGCDHGEILAHCRGDGTHVRGCWVVDLVTGREGDGKQNASGPVNNVLPVYLSAIKLLAKSADR